MSEGRIERLRRGEGARLRAIRLRALADAPEAFASTLEDAVRRGPEAWEAQIQSLPTFVWREGDVDLGMARGATHDRDLEAAYLLSMWVAPEARGRGVGAALIHEVVAWARGRGLRRLVLDVGMHNAPARRLYERQGFVVSGTTGTLPPPRASLCELEMTFDLAVPVRADGERPLDLVVLPEVLAVCRLAAGAATPAWLETEGFTAVVRTPDETAVVCREAVVPEDVRAERGWRAIGVAGPLDFALTGILLALVRPLAAVGVSVFAISTFDTDYLLVKEAALDDAVVALARAGHRFP